MYLGSMTTTAGDVIGVQFDEENDILTIRYLTGDVLQEIDLPAGDILMFSNMVDEVWKEVRPDLRRDGA